MSLEDLFNEYRKYTKDKTTYYSSNFSRKVREAFCQYGLDNYLLLITPENPENKNKCLKEIRRDFTEDEVERIGYFLSCATSRYTTNPEKYPDVDKLNPFIHASNKKNVGITDVKKFTDKCIMDSNGVVSVITLPHFLKISELIEFSFELKKCLKRLIIAIFHMNNFNKNTFNRILSRLNGFVDELYLLGGIKNFPESDLSYHYEGEETFYRTVDILAAADAADVIYFSKTAKQKESLEECKGYLGLVNSTDFTWLNGTKQKGYREQLRSTISRLYKNYVNLIASGCDDIDIYEKYSKKLGVNLKVCSVETLIFIKYVIHEGKKILSGSIDMEEAIDKTYKDVERILLNAEKMVNEDNAENTALDDDLDKLLFKPFLKYHNEDLTALKERIKNNSEALSKVKR